MTNLLHSSRVLPSSLPSQGNMLCKIRTAGSGPLMRVVPSADGYEVSHVLRSLGGAVELSIHSALRTLLQRPTSSARTT